MSNDRFLYDLSDINVVGHEVNFSHVLFSFNIFTVGKSILLTKDISIKIYFLHHFCVRRL